MATILGPVIDQETGVQKRHPTEPKVFLWDAKIVPSTGVANALYRELSELRDEVGGLKERADATDSRVAKVEVEVADLKKQRSSTGLGDSPSVQLPLL